MTCFLQLSCVFFLTSNILCNIVDNTIESCNLSKELVREIASYAPIANRIINETVYGKFSNRTYDTLAQFIDKFGSRIAGSENLENAIDYMLQKSKELDLENVHGETVSVPHWVRGNESATLLSPRRQKLSILGLAPSVGTPPEGIRAEVIVVKSFEELENISAEVQGKIVVFDQDYVSYGISVKYRDYAAVKTAELGGVATLVRSITPFSLHTLHTGWQDYSEDVKKIPTASITVEDANMLRRMQDRGDKIVIEMFMDSELRPDTISRNSVVEIAGSSKPENVVIVSGHLDSWDVGQGAMDDGGGAFISWNSLVILKKLGLRPKRTLRCILWTAEEEGLVGAFAYAKQHANDFQNINFVMESDEGTFTPLGLEYAGPEKGECILKEVLKLLAPINATHLAVSDNVGSDIMVWIKDGMPGASLLNKNEKYFWYHHSEADTLDVENPVALDKATAVWATVAYILADISVDMPKNY